MSSQQSRIFRSSRRVRVGDCNDKGTIRVDALARYLQDIGYDDTDDIGVGDGGLWVARSIQMKLPEKEALPTRNEYVNLETYCGGVGKAFAQRVVNIETKANPEVQVETLTTWVCIDENGKPTPIPQWFFDAYPEAQKSKAPRILNNFDFQQTFEGTIIDWKLRASDVDINGHVNNAMAFSALYEVAHRLKLESPREILVEYHHPLKLSDSPSLYIGVTENGFDAWLISGNNVAAAMRWTE